MLKKMMTLTVVSVTLLLGACQEDTTMEELIQDTELNGDEDKEDTEGFPILP